MRQLKFRGKSTGKLYKKGKFYYGFLSYSFIGNDYSIMFEEPHGWNVVQVEPDSIQELIGRDCTGREVYEGDTLIDCNGDEYTAAIYDPPQVTASSTLKEGKS